MGNRGLAKVLRRGAVLLLGIGLLDQVPVPVPLVAPAPAAADDPLPTPTVPGLESPEPDPEAPTIPLGDFSLPPGTTLPDDPAGTTVVNQPGSVIGRTISSTTYDNGDGTSTVRIRKGVVNFEDDKGVWRAIDRRLAAESGGGYRMTSGPFEARFASETGSDALLTVAKDGWQLGFRDVGLVAGRNAVIEGATATYPNVGPGIDLVLEAGTDRVKETFRINAPLPLDFVPRFRADIDLVGLIPRPDADGGIAFLDGRQEVVAHIPPGLATDSNMQHDALGLTPRTSVVPTLSKAVDGWSVELAVDPAWLRSPDRVYPIFVDPTVVVTEVFQAGRDAGGADVVLGSGCGNCRYDGNDQIDANAYTNRIGRSTYTPPGTTATGEWEWYSYLFYDLAPVMRHNVTRATMVSHFYTAHVYPGTTQSYPARFTMWPVSQTWDSNTVTWDTKPNHRPDRIDPTVTGQNTALTVDLTSWMQNWTSGAWPSWGLVLDTAGENRYIRMAAMEQEWMGWDPFIDVVVTNTVPYHSQSQLVPAHGATVTTLTPTLSAPALSDAPENDRIQYWFRIGTVADAESGLTVNSGWLDTPRFVVPPGALRDGVAYHWKIFTRDQLSAATPTYSSWPPAELKVDLRLGTGGPSPYDTAGPVTVNLATGNATITASSPKFASVGGPIGVDLTYNSGAPSSTGLLGVYVDGADVRNTLVRRDPVIDFSWNISPGPGIPSENWTATWTGFVRVPTAGSWSLGATHDDAVKISLGSPLATVLDRGCCGGVHWGSPVSFGAGQRLPVKIEYIQGPGLSHLTLWASGPGFTGVVPSDWLSTGTGILPSGWSMSSLTVENLLYANATLNDATVVLVGPEGESYRYTKQLDGRTWKPTNDADDIVVSTTVNGSTHLVVEADDGLTYTFNGSGKLIRVRSSLDDNGQTSPEYELDATSGNLTGIRDPVSGRRLELTYAPANGGTGDCDTTGFSSPPGGMLCKLVHPDGTVTKLLYNTNGQLARIEDPGGEVSDFAYDSSGRLAKIRDPLAHDAVKAPSPFTWPDDDTTRTLLTYDSLRRVASVTAPIARRNDSTRLAHSYDYKSSTTTEVDIAGITPPDNRTFARRVTFDAAGRVLSDTGLDNLTSVKEWEPTADRVLSETDTTGRRTTTHYDHAGRPTDVYGPAPAAWFGIDRRPLSGRTADVSRTTTGYDEGLRGLLARFWDNPTLSGPAKLHRLGVGSATGDLWYDWDEGGPSGLGATNNFSGRFMGEITFPAADYRVEGCADDGIRVWVDDTQVVDRWTTSGCTTSTWKSADTKPHKLRVEFRESTGNADVGLYWVNPTGTRSIVPGAALAPRLGLVTSETDGDGRKTTTRYAEPASGLPTASVADPDGLRLTTETAYEPAGAGYRRRASRRLPAADYASHVRVDSPGAHWRFDENYAATTARDHSGNGRDATYPTNAVLGYEGATPPGTSAELASLGVAAGDVFDFAGTSPFSVEAWVRPGPPTSTWQRLLSKEATDAAGRQGWLVWLHDDTFGFERWENGSVHTVSGGTTRSGQWTHVVATYDGASMRLYVNGLQVGSRTSARLLADTTGTLFVGDLFKGRIDEAAVYDKALSASRVTQHWRAGAYSLHSGLLDPTGAYWRLTEASGTTALDASGNNRHATYGAGVVLGEAGLVQPDAAVTTDGGPIASAGDVLDFAGTAAFSLAAWVKPATVDGTTRRILSKEAADVSGRQGWALWTRDGKLGFERVRDGVADKIEAGALTAGRWHHVAARFSGNTMRMYVDGEEVAVFDTTRSLLDTTGELRIGDGFKGTMTHAGVYTVALSSSVIRRHYRDGLAQRVTGTVHYLPTESRSNPCPGGGSASQAGLSKLTVDPDPDGASSGLGRVEETVYDVLGRVVASRVNSEFWSCTTYDTRGRVAQRTAPAFGGQPARTTTFVYAVGGDPMTSSVTESDGTVTTTVTTTVDLLGRVISHSDTWGAVTTTTYDQAGRVTRTAGPGGQVDTDYRANGWVDAQRLSTLVVARPAYNGVGEVTAVSYPTGTGNRGNGTAFAVDYDTASGRPTRYGWTQASGGLLASDQVGYTVGGQVVDQRVDGVDHHAGDDFQYDGAGRLTNAWVPGHTLVYAFADNNTCGQAPTAGRNTNRTSVTDNGATTAYCYDSGDKLTSTTDARYSSVAYDSRFNTTTLGDETHVYDGAGNHAATTKGATTVRYVRDGLGRIIERQVNGTPVARYSYGGSGDAPTAVIEPGLTVVETTVPLLGGVLLTIRNSGEVWSYPNIHGDVVAVADGTGAKVGSTMTYDPYGRPIAGLPDNSRGNFDYGWLGRHQRGVETEAGIATVQMGSRPYVPGLGRFLEVDPVEGGSANDYDYANADPVNQFDLDGNWPRCKWCRKQWNRARGAGKAVGRFAWKYKYDIALTAAMVAIPGGAVLRGATLLRYTRVLYRTRGIGVGNVLRVARHGAHAPMPALRGGAVRRANWLKQHHYYRDHWKLTVRGRTHYL